MKGCTRSATMRPPLKSPQSAAVPTQAPPPSRSASAGGACAAPSGPKWLKTIAPTTEASA